MALLITNYAFAGQTYPNAYARVDNLEYDNTTKIAKFDLCIYTSGAEDKVFIRRISGMFVRVAAGTDMVEQAYAKLKNLIQVAVGKIATYEGFVAAATDEDLKMKYEMAIAELKKGDYYCLQPYTSLV